MKSVRSKFAGALFTNDTFWVSGGEDPQTEKGLKTTEEYQGSSFAYTTDLPESLLDHVMARINDTHMFVFCGRSTSSSFTLKFH